MLRSYRSEALAAVHEVALGLAEAGTMDKRRLRGFAYTPRMDERTTAMAVKPAN